MTAPKHLVGGLTITGRIGYVMGINILSDYRLLQYRHYDRVNGMMVSGVSRRVCRDHHVLPTGVPFYLFTNSFILLRLLRDSLQLSVARRYEDGSVL